MPQTWLAALEAYKYPVELPKYERASEFPGFFERDICGNKGSTIEFEDYFRAKAPTTIKVWYEVAFWKLYRQGRKTVTRMVKHTREYMVSAQSLWEATQDFVKAPDRPNFIKLRSLLGQSYGMALPLTFVAFTAPDQFPMVDKKVALWVKKNGQEHSTYRDNKLVDFKSYNTRGATYFRDTDFESYLKWVW
jgi:hypothetical protein